MVQQSTSTVQPIKIQISKTKMLFGIGSCLLLIAMGCFVIEQAQKPDASFDPWLMQVAGVFCVVFFFLALLLGIKRMLDKKAALTIDENGITEMSHASSVGFVPWTDITGFRLQQFLSSRFILVFLYAPEKYLDNATGIKRKALKGNMKQHGTPVSINATTLDYDHKKLLTLLNERLQVSRNSGAVK